MTTRIDRSRVKDDRFCLRNGNSFTADSGQKQGVNWGCFQEIDPCVLRATTYEYFYRPQRSWGKVMFLHVSVILFTGEGVVSQHALQVVSHHTLQQVSGGGYPNMPCRFLGPHPGGKVEGSGQGGLQAHTQEGSWGVWPGGLRAHTQGVYPSMHLGRPPPGMHSCGFKDYSLRVAKMNMASSIDTFALPLHICNGLF